jgi:hypothetical protein
MDQASIEALNALKAELATLEPGNRSGGNPNKNVARMRELSRKVRDMTDALKESGLIAYSPEEMLKLKLDGLTEGRRKGCCIQLEGQWYRIRYTHRDPGRFPAWQHLWVTITAAELSESGSYVYESSLPPPP